MKTFIFEIPIESREYSLETATEDYGSEGSYNSDYPEHVYASMQLGQLFQDASSHCRECAMNMLVRKKSDPDTWEKWEKDMFDGYDERAYHWEKMAKKVKFARAEE